MKNQFHVYIASCTPDGGIYHYLCQDGNLQFREKTDADRPMYLTVAGDSLYAVLRQPFGDSGNSGVCSWKISQDGSLSEPSEIVNTGGRVGCHLTVAQDRVYVANYISGSVVMLPKGIIRQHTGNGPHPTRQEAAHTHFVGMTPDGKFLLAVDLGADTIFVYDPDLTLRYQISMPAGHGCRHLAWSEDGKYAFCINELTSTVSILRYNQGEFTLLDTVSALPENCPVESYAAAIRVVGDKVYISNRGYDSIAVFTHKDGVLTKPVFADTEGANPRDFYVYGEHLFCANQSSDCVSVFTCKGEQIQSKNLHLQIPEPLCVAVL